MTQGIFIDSISIELDSSVKCITKVAAMCLSGSIANGVVLAQNPNPRIKICDNRIEFGKCLNPQLQGIVGKVPGIWCFYVEYGELVYRYDTAWKCSFWKKELDYTGLFAPSVPDDITIFQMIYPKYGK